MPAPVSIQTVSEGDLGDLLPLMRAYCDFYEVAPSDDTLLTISRALIADPDREGVQLIGRDDGGTALGFATIYWSWTTTAGGRLATMNDLFVEPAARGTGLADALIAECLDRARAHDAVRLEWATALDNHRAQTVYDRVGGEQSKWLSYELRP